MKTTVFWSRYMGGFLVLLVCAFLLNGCATTDDPENISERPWNAPKSWEHGLPTQMFEGR